MNKKMTTAQQSALQQRARLVFRPGTPVDKMELFAGRLRQLKTVVNGINQGGQHVILYGERGAGKTSLAGVISEILASRGQHFLHGFINCDRQDTFSTIWHKALRKVVVNMEIPQMGLREEKRSESLSLNTLLPQNVVPDDIRHVFAQLGQPIIIIFDEVDTIVDKDATALLADTIKNLSDNAIGATLIMVGVADSVEELISEHRSIDRSLVQVLMPRMSPEELYQIMDRGASLLDMSMDEGAKRQIARLSQGLPHYAHSLSLYATLNAIEDSRFHIKTSDVDGAIRETVESSHSNLSLFDKATMCQQRNNIYREVLLACALATKTELGNFTPADVKEPLSMILGKTYDVANFANHLAELAIDKRGPVLKRLGGVRRPQYRFVNPMMQPFVILHSLAHGFTTDVVIQKFSKQQDERRTLEDLW